MVKMIERDELRRRLAGPNRPVLIEALPAKYYNPGHLPGAINVNYDEIEAAADRLPADKTAEIVTYCASETCPNSHKAAEALARLGYSNVSVYSGGKKDWTEAGLPLETREARAA